MQKQLKIILFKRILKIFFHEYIFYRISFVSYKTGIQNLRI